MESSTFDSIVPSRYISFTLPNPSIPDLKLYLHTNHIRIAILDSQFQPPNPNPPLIAAMLVPLNRESDWIFTTEAGHFQLLSGAPEVARLILIGNSPSRDEFGIKLYGDESDCMEKWEEGLHPLLVAFLPERNREMGEFEITFLRYEDNVVKGVILERVVGPVVGEILIEDVEIEGEGHEREFRRRLRFKRMPNLVQSEIKIVPLCLKDMKFEPDLGVLVHIYLAPMVASLSLISGHLQACLDSAIKPRALCVGVGGGALLGFLATQLGFEVMGVEVDQVVLRVARQYFGLEQCDLVRVFVGDGIEFLKKMSSNRSKDEFGAFDVIMVDLDPGDFRRDTSVPPSEFMQESVLLAAKSCLSGAGLLVLNVIPPDRLVYEDLKRRLKEVFSELYEIDTGNGENFVVIATLSRIEVCGGVHENTFLTKLRSVTSGAFVDTIGKT